MKLGHFAPLCSLLWLTTLPAAAQDVKRECVDASTAGQISRDAGELLKARSELLSCARDACPAVVRASCSQWLSDVERQLPSVVIRAIDSAGRDVTEGRARIDDSPVPLDGKPLPLDPGPHVIVVEAPRGARLEKKVLLAAGEQARLIELRAAPPPPRRELARVSTLPGAPPPRASSSVGPWLLGATSLVALGSFSYFAIAAKKELHRLETTCSPACPPADSDTGRRDALVADISLGVSLATLTGALTWALLDARRVDADTQTARLALVPTQRGGVASVSGRF